MVRRLLLVCLASCATLAESAGGDSNLPTSGVGPFRKLAAGEVIGTAPYVLDDATADYRQPSALALGTGVALYLVVHATSGHDVIARTRADDGRTFYGSTEDIGTKPQQVLASDASWEGADLAHPSALSVGTGVWLYYTSNGSVGLAQSPDGLSFTKVSGPVFQGPVDSATVAQLPDGTFDMLFATGGAFWEATSADGLTWQRATDPVLAPGPGEVSIADPFLAPRVTAANRLQMRVLYASFLQTEGGSTSAIAFAARYGSASAPLTRNPTPVYSVSKNERAPTLYENDGLSLLYVDQDSSDGTYRAIAAGVAPATATLAPPGAFPDSP
jgi:hypothetical protein